MAGFFDREVIRPEVIDTYGPYQNLTGQLDQSYATAQNRAAQQINQMYGNVGMDIKGPAATSARARSATDFGNQRAQQGYQSYYDWLKGKQLAAPQIQPSGASTLAAPFVSEFAKQAVQPGNWSAAAKGLGGAYNWMTSGGAPASEVSPGGGAGSGFGGWEGGYGDVMGSVGSAVDYSPYVSAATDFSPYVSQLPEDAFSMVDLFSGW